MKPRQALPLLAAATLLSSCHGCNDDKPYTPFGTTTALPSAETSAPAPSASSPATAAASAAPSGEPAVRAPSDATKWQLGERTLDAPPGYVFEQAVQSKLGTEANEVVAWLVADATDAGPRSLAELWLYPAAGAAKKLVELPGFVPSGPGCKLTTDLALSGPHTVVLDARGECAGALIARSPVRALVVVEPYADAPVLLTLRVAAPAPGEALDLRVNSSDRDGDGRDDVEVTVSGGAAGPGTVAAPLVWLDRAAGISRDATEPQRALVRLAQTQANRARTKKLAEEVLHGVSNERRLLASLCAEGATPRVLDADGEPVTCGSLSAVVDALASAEVGADLARGDVLDAFGALTRDGWYYGKTSASVRQRLEREVLDAVEPATALVKVLDPLPTGLERAPRYSPLAFDAAGNVLVLTAAGTVRTQPDGSSPSAPDPAATRSLDVLAAPGQRWQSVTYSCDRSEVALALEGAPPLVTALLSPRPGACGHSPFWASAAPPPVAAGGGKIQALVGGALVGDAPDAPVPAGAARSTNGAWTVVPTSFGLLIDGAAHRLVNLGANVPQPLALTDCVVNTTGKAAACVYKRQALLIALP
ncbi:MAG TPA: hypothetical protein VMI54_24355 [Polyangiaceae bacterium]|nr:hypothetical protein [Polyangiaceae bacterium]